MILSAYSTKMDFAAKAEVLCRLVRMRSAVRICPAAPKKAVVPGGATAFFAYGGIGESNCRPPIERGEAERKRHHNTERASAMRCGSSNLPSSSSKKASPIGLAFLLELLGRFELPQRIALARSVLWCLFRSASPRSIGGRQFDSPIPPYAKKAVAPPGTTAFFGAAGQIRTADLILTKRQRTSAFAAKSIFVL